MSEGDNLGRGWLDKINLLAVKTLAGVVVFLVLQLVCIVLIARNNSISEGLTIFTSTAFAADLAILGVSGWQAIARRKTEWEPSQEAKDTIQLNRHLDASKPIITNATTEHPVMPETVTVPHGGQRPRNADATGPIEDYAARQRALGSDIAGEGD